MKHYILLLGMLAMSWALATSCTDDKDHPGPKGEKGGFQNDCIKRTLGPNVAGLDIYFIYGMAMPYGSGEIKTASVEASIPGADGTYMENNSYHTSASGGDTPVLIGSPSVTTNGKTDVTFTVDTCAATLRYFYKIPEDAKGKSVTFTFSATNTAGQTVTYDMGPYQISNMDMKLDMVATDNDKCYISIADLAVYDAAEAATKPDKIDLVYLHRPNIASFAHALVSPGVENTYLPGITLPSGVSNKTPIRRVYQLRDRHLARLQYGVYVDDPDFAAIDFTNMPLFSLNLMNEYGVFVETQDGKYRAYVYVNAVNPGTSNSGIPANSMKISIKRYTMK